LARSREAPLRGTRRRSHGKTRTRPQPHSPRRSRFGAHTLGDLRRAFRADVKSRIIAEIDKDLTNLPVEEIEKHIVG
jgi:hypothetical protein